jgi:hypothetical protein
MSLNRPACASAEVAIRRACSQMPHYDTSQHVNRVLLYTVLDAPAFDSNYPILADTPGVAAQQLQMEMLHAHR